MLSVEPGVYKQAGLRVMSPIAPSYAPRVIAACSFLRHACNSPASRRTPAQHWHGCFCRYVDQRVCLHTIDLDPQVYNHLDSRLAHV